MSNVKKEKTDCIWCLRGLFDVCLHTPSSDSTSVDSTDSSDSVNLTTYKTNESLKDQQSTGRKRAASLYPLDPKALCEWAGKENVGGGQNPISGCGLRSGTFIGTQQSRHHGPDKNTLNNEVGNVHRICHSCHNEWHGKNDKDYVPGSIIGD